MSPQGIRRRPRSCRGEEGMVTAETAVVLPVLLLVLVSAVAAVTVVGAQLRCVDAAREAARAVARGEDAATVSELVERAAPDGAVTTLAAAVDEVRVTVTASVPAWGPPPLRVAVSAEAVALREPAAGTPDTGAWSG